MAGDAVAGRFLFERLDPKPRGRPIALPCAAGTLAERFAAVFAAVAAGEVTPDEALALGRLLDLERKLLGAAPDTRDAAPALTADEREAAVHAELAAVFGEAVFARRVKPAPEPIEPAEHPAFPLHFHVASAETDAGADARDSAGAGQPPSTFTESRHRRAGCRHPATQGLLAGLGARPPQAPPRRNVGDADRAAAMTAATRASTIPTALRLEGEDEIDRGGHLVRRIAGERPRAVERTVVAQLRAQQRAGNRLGQRRSDIEPAVSAPVGRAGRRSSRWSTGRAGYRRSRCRADSARRRNPFHRPRSPRDDQRERRVEAVLDILRQPIAVRLEAVVARVVRLGRQGQALGRLPRQHEIV